YHNYTSSFSFDLDQAVHPEWMSSIPDTASLSSLSIPGTHDTFTFDLVDNNIFQCQNHNLQTQLRAGLRYFDIRGRLLYGATSSGAPDKAPPPNIGIFHGHVYTGYTFQDVLLAMFAFLDEHPSEGIVMRVKEEGTPLPVGGDGDQDIWTTGVYNVTFEEAFNYYRLQNSATAQGCEEHLLFPWPSSSSSSSSPSSARVIPTVGELRSRILVLYEFDTPLASNYGIPWTSDHIALEDLWIILDPQLLDNKWDAVRQNLLLAGASAGDADKLFLSHLSASVGVLPIEAAAGPLEDRTNGSVIAGINDRTGLWLEEDEKEGKGGGGGKLGEKGKTGVIMGDFPGKRLVEDILRRNEWLS
ncbi:PLC-like phosphodiesterase, partial [Cryphonectria parasitica EP155]